MIENAVRAEILARLASQPVSLSNEELNVLSLRWGIDGGQVTSISSVALELGLAPQSVRSIEQSALKKLLSGEPGKKS